jgi:hypothetical protein
VVKTLALIDYVRANPPTTREKDHRIWGPFPSDTHPGWQMRVVMDKAEVPGDPLGLRIFYAVQTSPAGAADFTPLLSGDFQRSAAVPGSQGHMEWHVRESRASAYPVDADGMAELDGLIVDYDNTGFPRTVHLTIVNRELSATRGGTYDYQELADGSGTMTFDWQTAAANLSAKMLSRWQGAGAGRADVIVTLGNTTVINGTDCWGADTLATYIFRRDGVPPEPLPGATKAACLFPDPI